MTVLSGHIRRVLIVEDNPVIARLWQKKISMAGYEVRLAEDGHEARWRMTEWRPDAVLLDIALPDTDGVALCREWKDDEATAGTRIVFVSAFATLSDSQAAMDAGADAYVRKSPSAAGELISILASQYNSSAAAAG